MTWIDPELVFLRISLCNGRNSARDPPPVSSSAFAIPRRLQSQDLPDPCKTSAAVPRVDPRITGARWTPASTTSLSSARAPPPDLDAGTSTRRLCSNSSLGEQHPNLPVLLR